MDSRHLHGFAGIHIDSHRLFKVAVYNNNRCII